EFDGRVVIDVGPERGVRGIFALHGVVADELEGELVAAGEEFRRQGQGCLQQRVVFAAWGAGALRGAGRSGRSGLRYRDGGDEGAVQSDFEMAERRDQCGRSVIAQVHGRRLDELRLWEGEADGAEGVDAMESDRVGDAEIGEGK